MKKKKNKKGNNKRRGLLVRLIRFILFVIVGTFYFIYFIFKNLHTFIGKCFMSLPRITKVMTVYTLIFCASFGLVVPYFTNDKVENAAIQTTRKFNVEKFNIKTVQAKTKEKPKPKVNNEINSTKQSVMTATSNDYKNYAHDLVINTYGWSESDYECLVKLWTRESSWRADAHNTSSGAHGIPQSLPASKMASEGADYYTNGYTQIRWGLKYILGRYGSPTNAWAHSEKYNWY